MEVLFFPGIGKSLADATAEARDRLIKWHRSAAGSYRAHSLQFSTSCSENHPNFVFVFTVFIIPLPR